MRDVAPEGVTRTGMPQSCWWTWQAGNSTSTALVARGGERSDVQDAFGYAVREDGRPAEGRTAARPVDQQPGR